MFSFRDATGSSVSSNRHILTRTKDILLIKEGNDVAGFGFTVRGGCGAGSDPAKYRPLVITYIRPNSPADR